MFNFKTITVHYMIFIFTVVSTSIDKINNDEIEAKEIIEKYLKNVPSIDSKYIINEALSKTIAQYFNGKISAFPLFKVSINIDKNPVKIPWTLDTEVMPQNKRMKKRYRYINSNKNFLQEDNKRINSY